MGAAHDLEPGVLHSWLFKTGFHQCRPHDPSLFVIAQIAESYRVLTSNKEGNVICEIDGWVLGGRAVGGAGAGAVLTTGGFEQCRRNDPL